MNNQPILKNTLDPSKTNIHSIFYTIQGEGPFTGTPAVFVRFHGCNLQCPLCDTDYTSRSVLMDVWEITADVRNRYSKTEYIGVKKPLVVITGGEPFRQKSLISLTETLLAQGYTVQIETNGTLFLRLPFSNPNLVIGCSPKTSVNEKLIPHISYYKYVVGNQKINPENGLPYRALNHPVGPNGVYTPDFSKVKREQVSLQPEDPIMDDSKIPDMNNSRVIDRIVKICLQRGYKVSLQLHKILNVE